MNKNLLKEGDVVFLDNGMAVNAAIPSLFVYVNRGLTTALTNHTINVGHEYLPKQSVGNAIDMLSNNIKTLLEKEAVNNVSIDDIKEFVSTRVKTPKQKKFIISSGEFVVIKTQLSGGGSSGLADSYPDGHHVTCKRLKNGEYDEKGEVVNFYQTGSFNNMIENISPIRTMKPSFQ